jgi:hypothetical protein
MKMARTRNAAQTESEASVQEQMFRSLLQTPHRKVDETLAVHQEQFERDPNFYGHLAIFAVLEGGCVVRDVNDVFTAIMLASPYPEHREAGYVMFQSLPPHQAARVAKYYTGWDEIVKHHSYDPPMPKNGEFGVTYEKAKYGKTHAKAGQAIPRETIKVGRGMEMRGRLMAAKKIDRRTTEVWKDTYRVHHRGLGKRNFTGMLRSAARSFCRVREQDQSWMEAALIRNRNTFRTFYARTHTVPQNDENGWINRYLFRGEVQDGTRMGSLRKLAGEKDPTKQAQIIVDSKLPYTTVVSCLSNVTPTILVALVESMSAQELMQSLNSLKRRGAFDHPELKKLIEGKLKKAKTAKRVDALKGQKAAAAAADLDDETRQLVKDVSDTQLKRHGSIRARTAMFVDKSGSMEQAIELAKELGAAIAQACEEGNAPITYMFDRMPTEIRWTARDGDITRKSSWDEKLKMFRANGGTAPATVVRALILNKVIVDQIVLITDEGENNVGEFANELKSYERQLGVLPNVVIVRVGTGYWVSDRMEKSLQRMHVPVDVMPCQRIDQVAIPNLIQLLSRKSVFELVQEILALPLPTRAEWDEAHLKKNAEVAA